MYIFQRRFVFPPEIMFWRTRTGMEVDVIEKVGQVINAYECKLNNNENVKFTSFLKLYPEANVKVINPENLLI